MLEKIDEAANNWNKTKDSKYKDLWYKLIKEYSYGKNFNNTRTFIQWNTCKRKIQSNKTNGST